MHIIAYHCQQASEKYLKACLLESEKEIPFIHDLGRLNRICVETYPDMDEIQSACERLTPFGTVTRYLGSSMSVTEDHIPLVLALAEKVRVKVTHIIT